MGVAIYRQIEQIGKDAHQADRLDWRGLDRQLGVISGRRRRERWLSAARRRVQRKRRRQSLLPQQYEVQRQRQRPRQLGRKGLRDRQPRRLVVQRDQRVSPV